MGGEWGRVPPLASPNSVALFAPGTITMFKQLSLLRGRIHGPGPRRSAVGLTVVLFALLGPFHSTSFARDSDNPSIPMAAGASVKADGGEFSLAQPLLASWLDKAFTSIESVAHGRQRMMQVGALIMALALFIIWWRK